MEKFNLLGPLAAVNPSMLSYQEWCDVGMALKHEGYSVNDWDSWSRSDPGRYHEGECERKWNTFKGTNTPVTGATITQMAKNSGWQPHGSNPDGNEFIGWNDSFVTSIDKDYKIIDPDYIGGRAIQAPTNWNPAEQIINYLKSLFDMGEVIRFVNDAWYDENNDKWKPGNGVYTQTAGTIIEKLQKSNGDIGAVMGDPEPQAGAWICVNPLDGKGTKNNNVTDYRFVLVESDSMELEKQNELLRKLELPIATLTYSGSRSLHAVVKVDAVNLPQYQERVDHLYKILEKNGLRVDKQNKNPARLTRLPGFQRGEKKQFLIATNIGQESWDDWQDYIEDMNDNLPEMENMSDLFDKPIILAPELISGVLRQGHKMLIAGPSKAGKSFALIQLAIAIAEGWRWFNFQCQRGRVLYVNLELDERSAKKRFVEIYNTLGRGHDHVDNIDVWNLRGKTSPMDKLAPKLIRRAEKSEYKAVIIDPIYKVLTGDENNAHDMSLFVNQFDLIATELKCSVIYAHHHSKGAQGGKASMDRSSGSGVFARDPDAILDLIELPVDEPRYDQRENEAICSVYQSAIKHFNSNYEIPLDDTFSLKQMSHHLLAALTGLPNSKQILKQINERKNAAVTAIRQATAWRLSGTLREFPKFDSVNAWFQYPIHVLDDSLQDIKIDDDQKTKWKKGTQKANQSKSEKSQQELEEAFNILSMDGGAIEVNKIADYLEVSKRAVYNRIKKSKNFSADGGMIEKTNDNDK